MSGVFPAILDSNDPIYKIIGIGLWHEDDTKELERLVHDVGREKQSADRITRPVIRPEPRGVTLINLAEVLDAVEGCRWQDKPFGTTRVIRIYQHTGAKVKLLQRIDWENELPGDDQVWIPDDIEPKNLEQIDQILNDKIAEVVKRHRCGDVQAVVVKDMLKGVVSKGLISCLAEKYKDVPWFVASKEWRPKWLSVLSDKGVDVRLVLFHQSAARTAVRDGNFTHWILRKEKTSKEALEQVRDIQDQFTKSKMKPVVAVLPDGLSLFVLDSNDGLIFQNDVHTNPNPPSVETPIATVLLGAWAARYMDELPTGDPIVGKAHKDVEAWIKKALFFTQKWAEMEVKRISKPETWRNQGRAPSVDLYPRNESGVILNGEPVLSTWPGNWTQGSRSWDVAYKRWTEATKNLGIITTKNKGDADNTPKLELWRAMTEVDGYVCCIEQRRRQLRKLVLELGFFNDRKMERPVSCMLAAPPGSGKTYLVRSLAKSLGLRFLPFNITQMVSRNDLLDCFDSIVTTQAQNRDEPLLVFIDEINAKLQGQHVYDTFLAPLEDGIYVRAGKFFHVDPCVWVFAGTNDLGTTNTPDTGDSYKMSDFQSRLTVPTVDLNICIESDKTLERRKEKKALKSELGLEAVYNGVSFLRRSFPDVRWVQKSVLVLLRKLGNLQAEWIFQNQNDRWSVRKLGHFVKSFRDIQYGTVKLANVSEKWLEDLELAGLLDEVKEEIKNRYGGKDEKVEIVG